MGEIWVKGKKAVEFLQKVTSNDVSLLKIGDIQYTYLPNEEGGIVDDLLVYYFELNKYLLVVNASNVEKDFNWLLKHSIDGVEIENSSDSIAQLAIQGPKAIQTLQKLTDIDLGSINYYKFVVATFAGIENVIISATGYTGAGGFELYFYNEYAEKIWKAIFDAGEEFGIKPIGLGARDTLRLEMGFCLYGNDIDDTTSPIEAGLGWITKINDHKNFIGKELIVTVKNQGPQKRLRGFKMIDRGIPRHDYEIFNNQNEKIGKVTSGSISPILNVGIGMGYIQDEYAALGNEIFIQVRDKMLKATIVKTPFV